MATPVLIMGKSGSGKSASLRNVEGKWFFINVNNKPLPFRKKDNIVEMDSDNILTIREQMAKAYENGYKSIVLDDAGYLMTAKFMLGHRQLKGNASFELYNDIADSYYSLIKFITDELADDLIVYVIMHETVDDYGNVKPQTLGRLLDEKVCIPGMFTIVLRALKKEGKYFFVTNSDGNDTCKSPIGLFADEYIDNDIQFVDKELRKYYEL